MRETLEFLAELAVNNNKDWFDANRARYQACRDRFVAFSTEYIARLTEFDPTLKGLQPKDCILRINRDIRFSADKRPYKEWFGVFPATGRSQLRRGGADHGLQIMEEILRAGF